MQDSGGSCPLRFLGSGVRGDVQPPPWINDPGELHGVCRASGEIHVGTSMFFQRPDPPFLLPSPIQDFFLFCFVLFCFALKEGAMLLFLSTNFHEAAASFRVGRMHLRC